MRLTRRTSSTPTAPNHSTRRVSAPARRHASTQAIASRGASTGRSGAITSARASTSPSRRTLGRSVPKAAQRRMARSAPMPPTWLARKSRTSLPVGMIRTAEVAETCSPHVVSATSPSTRHLSPIAGSPIMTEFVARTRKARPWRSSDVSSTRPEKIVPKDLRLTTASMTSIVNRRIPTGAPSRSPPAGPAVP